MNRILIQTMATALFGIQAAVADVPSLINYQGRLTDATGAPVTGSKSFALSIYDAPTGGNVLYTETIGAVTLDANGVYSFQFGGAGTSNTLVSETVATTDGALTTFQKVLANSPVVAGSVSVADGTYTWNQNSGSSNDNDFGVAYSTSLRRVTVTYYAGAPAAGRTITATYRYGTSGITGALSNGAEHWIAISMDGVVQGTRQRVLAVPFAMNAARATTAATLEKQIRTRQLTNWTKVRTDTVPQNTLLKLPLATTYGQSIYRFVEPTATTIEEMSCMVTITNQGLQYPANVTVELASYSSIGTRVVVASQARLSSGQLKIVGPFNLDHSQYEYVIECSLDGGFDSMTNVRGVTTMDPLAVKYKD